MTGNEIRLGPDDLVGREFAIGLRGYDRDEVDSFLAQAADAWRASMSAAPSLNGLSSSAMAALAGSEAPAPAPVAASDEPADPFAGPVLSDPFAAPVSDPFAAPAPADAFAAPAPPPEPESPIADLFAAPEPEPVPEIDVRSPAPEPTGSFDAGASRVESERDRAAAFAERKAAELDRANARTELARAQEDALHVVDQAQRRAEAVLTGARDAARAEAETVLEDARSRLTPLLEQERAVRARLARLRSELDAMVGGADEAPAPAPTFTEPTRMVAAAEDDPGTPESPFPVGFGSVSVGQ